MPGVRYSVEVRPVVPQSLARLNDLAGNLLYSWDRRTRGIFYRIDPALWEETAHNPKVFLRRVSQQRLDALATDRHFLDELESTLRNFDNYLDATRPENCREQGIDPETDLVAYFCMEYGFHESMKLYSGGLGVLAGDHCKAAADLGLPFVAVGLMYRQGYFQQTITHDGAQQTHYFPVDLGDLPIEPVRDDNNREIAVAITFPDRVVHVRAWQAHIGCARLLLLDTDIPENATDDRTITYQLYGGDRTHRIEQEIVLGIGGVRVLRAIGLEPTAWHLNEGHPAFAILERCREATNRGMDFDSALEMVAASTVFTTHTPVPAGHDLFNRELMTRYFQLFAHEVGITLPRLLDLGMSPQNGQEFNMTALGLRGSRRHNGVSRIHGRIAARMESYIWPQVEPKDNPLEHITNGVHVPTFLAREWVNLFDARYPDWRHHLHDPGFWYESIQAIPDHRFWSLRQSLKSEMLHDIREMLFQQYCRNQFSRGRIEQMRNVLSPENTGTLIIGFARRFATYKRAMLLFQHPERLARLLNNPERPVVILFAGKAHPMDLPGQALIQQINEKSAQPEFLGKIFFIENYDLALARKLVTGTDVWLNTPQYPLEASGTSGQKAAINGGLNVSVLDGWWAEGHDGSNGWAIQTHDSGMPNETRDNLESQELLDLLENDVIPRYFNLGPRGYSESWVEKSKASIYTILPRFSAHRMVRDYLHQMYVPAIRGGKALVANTGKEAQALAAWKRAVREKWSGVMLRWVEPPAEALSSGEAATLRVAARLDGLEPGDIRVECLLETKHPGATERRVTAAAFKPVTSNQAETIYELELLPPGNGLLYFRVHAFPWHPLLAHPFEVGLQIWI